MSDTKTGYMCKVDFAYEVGEAIGGNTIYPSITDLVSNCPCVNECGIVKVEINLVKRLANTDYKTGRTIEQVTKEAKDND